MAGAIRGSAGILTADTIKRPPHYAGAHPSGIEPIQITKYESFLRGNILKYVFRAPYKGQELEDLYKARQYLDWEIERLENGESNSQGETLF